MPELPDCETLLLNLDAGVLHITLNRPDSRNAMSLTMVTELRAVLESLRNDLNVRAIVLRGAGGHFCAGGDIKDMAGARAAGAEAYRELNRAFGAMLEQAQQAPQVVVAVLEGAVLGGGFGLACVSDVSLARDNVSFRLPETSLGIVPAQIAPFLVERLGYAEAKRLAVTGAKVDAQEALTIRLVHEVHADEASLDAALQRTLARILSCGPKAIAHTKQLLARARHTSAEYLIDDAAALFARTVLSEEGQEGTGAFMQKRAPSWMP